MWAGSVLASGWAVGNKRWATWQLEGCQFPVQMEAANVHEELSVLQECVCVRGGGWGGLNVLVVIFFLNRWEAFVILMWTMKEKIK